MTYHDDLPFEPSDILEPSDPPAVPPRRWDASAVATVIALCALSFVAGGIVQRYCAPGTPATIERP